MKLLAVIALAGGALALSAGSSTAGAAAGAPHHLRGLVRHAPYAVRAAQTRMFAPTRTSRATGFSCLAACSSYESTINQYFTDVAHDNGLTTNVYSAATQYSSIQYNETFAGSYVDGNPYPTSNACQDNFDPYCVTDTQLQTEIGKMIAARHWPTHSPTALYFIFTPAKVGVCETAGVAGVNNACTTNVFCAYHSATSSFTYAVEPDAAAVSDGACSTGSRPRGGAADDTISTISHEQNEAITDPLGDGWWSEDPESYQGTPNYFFGSENGDLCAYNFGAPLGTTPGGQPYNQVINGHDYFLQQEFSDADGGCVQHLGGTPTVFASSNPFYEGVGPLVYHTGPVMTTNTVYAIYWVPAPPVNTKPPTITGIPKVGKKLTASRGTWSNLPKFKYQWLRCSSTGTLCKSIPMATLATRILVTADKGHRLEVRVTATNMAGSATKISAPTAVITS